MQSKLTQHSTAQNSTAQHSTAQHSTAQRSTAQHSAAQRSTAQRSMPEKPHLQWQGILQQHVCHAVIIIHEQCIMCNTGKAQPSAMNPSVAS